MLITKIPNINAVVIKQEEKVFITTKDSIIISTKNLEEIVKYLLRNNIISLGDDGDENFNIPE